MFYLKKNKKRMLALCLSAALSVGSLTVYAATEQWNDASLTPAFTLSLIHIFSRGISAYLPSSGFIKGYRPRCQDVYKRQRQCGVKLNIRRR